ncbi:MAG: resolvase [Prochlorococcus sp.]|nr:resolvase [Prochlorococcaceae cyanobacterium Fu_MAG_50]
MFPRSLDSSVHSSNPAPDVPRAVHGASVHDASVHAADLQSAAAQSEALVAIDDVQKSLNRSRASVYRYTNTDPRNLNPPFNPRKLNAEYRSDQKDPLLFHPNEVARFAKDVLRIKEVTVEVLNSPSTATQQVLGSILEELRMIRSHLESLPQAPADLAARRDRQDRPAA